MLVIIGLANAKTQLCYMQQHLCMSIIQLCSNSSILGGGGGGGGGRGVARILTRGVLKCSTSTPDHES